MPEQLTEYLAFHPLISPILFALLAGTVAYLGSRWWRVAGKLLAVASAGVVLVVGVAVWRNPDFHTLSWTWLKLTDGVSLTLELSVTPLGMLVVIGSAAFALLITVYSVRAMAGNYWEGKFYAYLIWALAGACLVGLAGNLLVLLIGWELVTLMLFLMIGQGGSKAKHGAAKAYSILGFADACLLLALALLAAAPGGSANWWLGRAPVSVASMGSTGYVVYVLILIAALAKAGAIPLHTWVPAVAADAPTPVMAYLPAALDKLLGIYLLAVLSLRMFTPDWTLQVVMMVIGAVTILAAMPMAMMQHNLKRMLSFCAVSQVGYMVLGLGTGTVVGIVGGLFHMLNHAIYKSNLFLMSGTVSRASGTDEIEDMGGLARVLPVTFVCGLISAAAISGVPPMNGFASKWLVYQGALEVSAVNGTLAAGLVIVAVFGSALTLATFVKVMYAAFLSPAPKPARVKPTGESFWLAAPMVVLAAACVVLGLAPSLAINHLIAPAVGQFGGELSASGQGLSVDGVGFWNPAQAATGLIVVGLVFGFGLAWLARMGSKVRVVRPFLSGEVPGPADDRFRVPGSGFYETIRKLPVLGPLLDQGEAGAMDAYHISGRGGHALVEMLRARHTGLVGLYVVWVVLGLTVTLIYLLLSVGS